MEHEMERSKIIVYWKSVIGNYLSFNWCQWLSKMAFVSIFSIQCTVPEILIACTCAVQGVRSASSSNLVRLGGVVCCCVKCNWLKMISSTVHRTEKWKKDFVFRTCAGNLTIFQALGVTFTRCCISLNPVSRSHRSWLETRSALVHPVNSRGFMGARAGS